MSDLDLWVAKLKDLENEITRLRFRVSRLEEYIEQHMDPPPMRVEVVPTRVVGVAAEMGAALSEAKSITRSSKESARNLRRVVSPEDDTGKFATSDAKPRK